MTNDSASFSLFFPPLLFGQIVRMHVTGIHGLRSANNKWVKNINNDLWFQWEKQYWACNNMKRKKNNTNMITILTLYSLNWLIATSTLIVLRIINIYAILLWYGSVAMNSKKCAKQRQSEREKHSKVMICVEKSSWHKSFWQRKRDGKFRYVLYNIHLT